MNPAKPADRVISISYKPYDTKHIDAINALKKYARIKGMKL